MIDIYEFADDRIEHMEIVSLYMRIDDHHDMIHEQRHSNNHNHLVNPPFYLK
jgi:hypothetical protein